MKEFKVGDEVFNLLEKDWTEILKREGNYVYRLSVKKDGKYIGSRLENVSTSDEIEFLLSYNPFDPDDPKNRDMPDWMQRYHGMRKELQDIRDFLKADENESTYDEVVRVLSKEQKQPHNLEEVKRKIYAVEMAIENNDWVALKKCCKVLWPNGKEPNGINKFYYHYPETEWDSDCSNPCPSSILATDLLKLIEAAQAEDAPKPLTLEEVKQAIYNRLMAIENDNILEILVKCCKALWPKGRVPNGSADFYYQDPEKINDWYSNSTNPLPFSILATDLVKLIDQSADYAVKPPLGLIPKHIHDTMRKKEILEAMQRYTDAGKAIPVEWLDELRSLA